MQVAYLSCVAYTPTEVKPMFFIRVLHPLFYASHT